jgi:phage protein D
MKTFEEIAKKYSNFYTPHYQVIINGKDIAKEHLIEIVSVTFEDMLEGADRFSISVSDREAKWLDNGLFEPGKEVEIKMGYVDRLSTMIVGEIISLRPSFPTDGTPQLEISGYDLSHQFTRVRKGRSFKDKKDSEVVKAIAGEAKHKLATEIDVTATTYPTIAQEENQTDYQFIKSLAKRNFFEFLVKERTLYFRKTRQNRSTIMKLEYGSSLQSFSPELNTANQVSKVTVRGWDPVTKKDIVGTAEHGSEEARGSGKQSGGDMVGKIYGVVEERISDSPVFTKQEAEGLSRSQLNELSGELITGSAQCIGIPEIRAGENIEFVGLGKKFSKNYYIERTTHTIGSSGYTTTFSVKENTL